MSIPGPWRGAAFAEKRRCSLPRWGRARVGASMRRSVSARGPHPRLPPEGEGAGRDGAARVLFLVRLVKLGTVGAILSAILCPICFPKRALIVRAARLRVL